MAVCLSDRFRKGRSHSECRHVSGFSVSDMCLCVMFHCSSPVILSVNCALFFCQVSVEMLSLHDLN